MGSASYCGQVLVAHDLVTACALSPARISSPQFREKIIDCRIASGFFFPAQEKVAPQQYQQYGFNDS